MDCNRAEDDFNGANLAAMLGILTFNILILILMGQLEEIYNNDDTTTLEILNKVNNREIEEEKNGRRKRGVTRQSKE